MSAHAEAKGEPAPAAGLTVSAAVARALAFSPKLAGSRAGADAAQGSERQAGALPNPELGVEAENFGGSRDYRDFDSTEYTYSASQLIELGGKRDARRSSASAERKAAEIGVDIARVDLIRDVTVAFMEAVAAEERLALAVDLENTASKVSSDVSRRVTAARDPLFQGARAEVALTNATIARQSAEAMRTQARSKLARYWGGTAVEGPLSAEAFYRADAPGDLAALESKLEAAPEHARLGYLRQAREADLELARARAVPDVRASVGVRQFAENGDTALVAGVSLPIPVFDQNQGDIQRAGAEVNRALSEVRTAELERGQQLARAWTEWSNAASEADTLRRVALPKAERAFKLALAGYRRGGFQYLDVLDAQRAFFETRGALIAALMRLHEAEAETERLTSSAPTTLAEE